MLQKFWRMCQRGKKSAIIYLYNAMHLSTGKSSLKILFIENRTSFICCKSCDAFCSRSIRETLIRETYRFQKQENLILYARDFKLYVW